MTGKGYVAVLRRGDEERELGPDEIISPDIPAEHSVINEWRFETPLDESLEFYRHGEALIFFEDSDGNRRPLQRGPVDSVISDDESAVTRLRGRDTTAFLSQKGPEKTIKADGVAWEEIERVTDTIDGWDWTVHEPDANIVDDELVVQQASTTDGLNDLFGGSIGIISDGSLQPPRTSFYQEADENSNAVDITRNDFSNGSGVSIAIDIEEVRIDVDLPYESDNLSVGVRCELVDSGPDNFRTLEVYSQNGTQLSGGITPQDELDWYFSDLASSFSGEEQLELRPNEDIAEDNDFGEVEIDGVAIFDDSFEYTFPNEVIPVPEDQEDDEVGYLNGPEKHPFVPLNTAESEITNNIRRAYIDAAVETNGGQSLAVSFDGETFNSEDNTTSLTQDNDDTPTVTVIGQLTIGHTDAVRDGATPRKGHEPQTLDEWELRVDADDLGIFEDREFSGNYYELLQEMHNQSGLVFRAPPDEDTLKAETFEKGSITDDVDWTRLSFEREFDVTNYANSVTVVGESDTDGDDRPVVKTKSESEIERIGQEITAFIEARETSRPTLRNIARNELSSRLTADELGGTLEIVPRRLKPGYLYHVPAFDDELVLERFSFQDGRRPSCTLEFQEIVDIATSVSGVRRESRTGRR